MSKPPFEFGKIPCKVVLSVPDGTDPGRARILFERAQGEIGHFYRAAHQNAQLGGLGQEHRIKSIRGGQVRYSSNQGNETLFVKLADPTPSVVTSPIPELPKRVGGFLALDVIFDADYRQTFYHYQGGGGNYYEAFYERFTVAWMVGARIGVGPDAIEALWVWSGAADPGANPGLQTPVGATVIAGADRSVSSALRTGVDGLVQAGFLLDLEKLGFPGSTAVELFCASGTQTYHYDVREGPDTTYGFVRDTTLQVRAREYGADKPPGVVAVSGTAGIRFREIDTVLGVDQDVDDFLGQDMSGRGFFVVEGWLDPGGEVASLDAPGMGAVLVEAPKIEMTDIATAPVFALPGILNPVGLVDLWPGSVADMTKIGTVAWTPSGVPDVPGVAEFTAA